MNFWDDKRVMVTGGTGFVGKHIVNRLEAFGANVYIPKGDLRERALVLEQYWRCQPEIVIHLAALIGGISKNLLQPADMFYDNLKMGMEIIDAAKHTKAKIVIMGSACEYPKHAPLPLREGRVFDGNPESTNLPYGIAKRALLTMGQAYRKQYNMNIIHLLSTNLYGPGDNFGEGSHFIPAMIKRCVEANKKDSPSISVWGSGDATRDFLFVEDAAFGILQAAEKYNEPEPINLGSGREISIRETANKIKWLTGFDGDLIWDSAMPEGQPRRILATNLAKEKFGFEAETLLEAGLARTIEWYNAKSL